MLVIPIQLGVILELPRQRREYQNVLLEKHDETNKGNGEYTILVAN